jgi:hypothetical protein
VYINNQRLEYMSAWRTEWRIKQGTYKHRLGWRLRNIHKPITGHFYCFLSRYSSLFKISTWNCTWATIVQGYACMTIVVDFRDREVCQFIQVNVVYWGLLMMTSAIVQVLTFATICCDPVTYKFVNTLNQKRIHASVATRDGFEMIKKKLAQ